MIKYIFVDNYKSLVNFKIEFNRIDILLGKNGSGKSTVFEVIGLIRRFVCNHERVDSFFPASTTTRWMDVSTQTFELAMVIDGKDYCYGLQIEHDKEERKCRVEKEYVTCDGHFLFQSENGKAQLYNDSFTKGADMLWDWSFSGVGMVHDRSDNKLISKFKHELYKVLVCAPNIRALRYTSENEDILPDYECSNIISVFSYLSQRYPEAVGNLRNDLKEINVNLSSIYLEGNANEKRMYFKYNSSSEYTMGLGELSDGEKSIFVAYLILNGFVANGYTVMIDEPDNYLSLREIQPWCMSMEDKVGQGGQCIIISHSPGMIDYFAGANGIWLSRLKYGAARIEDAPLRGTEGLMTYSEIMRRGEIEWLE